MSQDEQKVKLVSSDNVEIMCGKRHSHHQHTRAFANHSF